LARHRCANLVPDRETSIPLDESRTSASTGERNDLASLRSLGVSVSQVEPIPESFIQTGEKVTVAIERQTNCGVSQSFLDLFRMRSLGDEQCGAGVAKIVKTESVGRGGSSNSWLEMTRVERTTKRLSFK
jgi:hypothetical protein